MMNLFGIVLRINNKLLYFCYYFCMCLDMKVECTEKFNIICIMRWYFFCTTISNKIKVNLKNCKWNNWKRKILKKVWNEPSQEIFECNRNCFRIMVRSKFLFNFKKYNSKINFWLKKFRFESLTFNEFA